MRRLVSIALVFASGCAESEDMMKYMDDTEALEAEGEYAEALERHIWFHNHALEHDESMYGVRLSFALSDWKDLGEKYPPALEAMKEVRDAKTEAILDGTGDWETFQDVASLNETLDDDARTLDLFNQLEVTRPELQQTVWRIARDVAIDAKRWDLLRKYSIDLLEELEGATDMYEHMMSMSDHPEYGDPSLKTHAREHFVDEILTLIEVALALDERDTAIEIQKRAQQIVAVKAFHDAIPPSGE